MKIDRDELYRLYMQEVDKICEECDWVSTIKPLDVINIISGVLENNPQLMDEQAKGRVVKAKPVVLTEDECATILVGLSEFEAVISEKKATFAPYEKLTKSLIEKFRGVCWDFHCAKPTAGHQVSSL